MISIAASGIGSHATNRLKPLNQRLRIFLIPQLKHDLTAVSYPYADLRVRDVTQGLNLRTSNLLIANLSSKFRVYAFDLQITLFIVQSQVELMASGPSEMVQIRGDAG